MDALTTGTFMQVLANQQTIMQALSILLTKVEGQDKLRKELEDTVAVTQGQISDLLRAYQA